MRENTMKYEYYKEESNCPIFLTGYKVHPGSRLRTNKTRTFQSADNCNLGLAALGCSRGQKHKIDKKVTVQVHGRHTIKLGGPDAVLNIEKLFKGWLPESKRAGQGNIPSTIFFPMCFLPATVTTLHWPQSPLHASLLST